VLACLAGLAGRRLKAAAAALAELVHRRALEAGERRCLSGGLRTTAPAEVVVATEGGEAPSPVEANPPAGSVAGRKLRPGF
jgi:hypothetical protein